MPGHRTEGCGGHRQTGGSLREVNSSTARLRVLKPRPIIFHHGDRGPNGAKVGELSFWLFRAPPCSAVNRQTTQTGQKAARHHWPLAVVSIPQTSDMVHRTWGGNGCHSWVLTKSAEVWVRYVRREPGDDIHFTRGREDQL